MSTVTLAAEAEAAADDGEMYLPALFLTEAKVSPEALAVPSPRIR